MARFFRVNEERTRRVGERPRSEPEQPAELALEEACLELSGQVDVEPRVTLVRVMQQVVVAERFRDEDAERQVDEDGKDAIVPRLAKLPSGLSRARGSAERTRKA